MEDTFGHKLFTPIRSRLSALNLNGPAFLQMIDAANSETKFQSAFVVSINRKCGQFAVDLFRDLKGSSLRQKVETLSSSGALSEWMIEELSHRICALMIEEDIDGHALCELERKTLARKMSKYLTLGPALKLFGNLESNLHAVHLRMLEDAHLELQHKQCVTMMSSGMMP